MNLKIQNEEDSVIVSSTKENFIITIAERKDDVPLEQAEITILMLGKKWVGTIQDLAAIQTYATNALKKINDVDYWGLYYTPLTEEIRELEQLLTHFTTTGPQTAIPESTAKPAKDDIIDLGASYLNNTYFLITSELGKNIGVTSKPISKSTLISALVDHYKCVVKILSISEPSKNIEVEIKIQRIYTLTEGIDCEETVTLTPTWLYE